MGKEDGVVRWVAAKGRGLFACRACERVFFDALLREMHEVEREGGREEADGTGAPQEAAPYRDIGGGAVTPGRGHRHVCRPRCGRRTSHPWRSSRRCGR